MRKQGNKMLPQAPYSPKSDLTDTEVEEAIGKELKDQMLRMFEEINETDKQMSKMLNKAQKGLY